MKEKMEEKTREKQTKNKKKCMGGKNGKYEATNYPLAGFNILLNIIQDLYPPSPHTHTPHIPS